jgi:hypothetical protein
VYQSLGCTSHLLFPVWSQSTLGPSFLPPFNRLLKVRVVSEDNSNDKEKKVLTMEVLLRER